MPNLSTHFSKGEKVKLFIYGYYTFQEGIYGERRYSSTYSSPIPIE